MPTDVEGHALCNDLSVSAHQEIESSREFCNSEMRRRTFFACVSDDRDDGLPEWNGHPFLCGEISPAIIAQASSSHKKDRIGAPHFANFVTVENRLRRWNAMQALLHFLIACDDGGAAQISAAALDFLKAARDSWAHSKQLIYFKQH